MRIGRALSLIVAACFLSACGGPQTYPAPTTATQASTGWTALNPGGTTTTIPTFDGIQVTVIVPAVVSGSAQYRVTATLTPPTGYPTLQSLASRAGALAGSRRRNFAGIANTPIVYLEFEVNGTVTLAGLPGYKISLPGNMSANPPFYIAFIPPPPTAWNLNTEGPGGTANPHVFNPALGNYTFDPSKLYVFAMYTAVGPRLNVLPSNIQFLLPNRPVQVLISDPAAVRITSISSSDSSIVAVTPASGQTDLGGHMLMTLTSGTSPGNATVTVNDENGNVATVTVGNTITNSGVTIPGLPTAQQFSAGMGANTDPFQMAAGPDGNVWFTENGAYDNIGSIDSSGTITGYSGFTSQPSGITAGPDAAMWMTEPGSAKLARLSTAAGTLGAITEDAADVTEGALNGPIATGSDNNIWYSETAGLGVTGLNGSVVAHYSTGAGSSIQGLTLGPDGNLWFTDAGNNRIGKITAAGATTFYSTGLTAAAGLTQIVSGSDGNLWFGENTAQKIASINPATGAITEYDASSVGGALALGAGPDGNIWFSAANNNLGRITPAGVLTLFVTGASGQDGIVAGADGKLYFTESTSNAIGRLSL